MSKKKDKPEGAAAPEAGGLSVANNPRAVGAIRRARARAALGTFVLVVVLCVHGGAGAQTGVLRGLVFGMAAFVITWAIAVALWRQILLAEVRRAHEARQARRREQIAAAQARRSAAA
jgi:hypothetical protein